MDKVIDRLLEIQVDEAMPIYLIPVPPIERVLEELERPQRKLRPRIEVEEETSLRPLLPPSARSEPGTP